MCPRVAFGHVCGGITLIITLINLSGKTQFTVGSSIPQEVDPEWYKKRETELNTSKQISEHACIHFSAPDSRHDVTSGP